MLAPNPMNGASWEAPRRFVGQRIAIHAGLIFRSDGMRLSGGFSMKGFGGKNVVS